jgi:hypothetical protein
LPCWDFSNRNEEACRSEGSWSREPISIAADGSSLIVEAAAESDWWRNTSYGFIHDDGHALLRDFPNESAVEVSFVLNYTEQFDQAGPMFCAPTRAGLKITFTGWSIGEADFELHS